jgi:endonuclease/exonuclease/phosphatase family metal-dependent hydrolase
MRTLAVSLASSTLAAGLLVAPAAATDGPSAAAPNPQPTAGGATLDQSAALAPTGPITPARKRRASFVVATFNVLGHSHTAPGGKFAYMASGVTRTFRTLTLLNRHNIDVVGLQEFQRTQLNAFHRRARAFNVYPGVALKQRNKQNAVAWRTRVFKLVKASQRTIPYFNGHRVPIPVVRLKHRATGAEAFFISVHNAANRYGKQKRWRDAAMRIEIRLAHKLWRRHGIPVFMTGDMNEKARYFCAFTRSGRMHAAAGGSNGRVCRPPDPRIARIDWIFGTKNVRFRHYRYLRTPLVQRTSDHPLIRVRARIPVR